MNEIQEKINAPLPVGSWSLEDISAIHEKLELPNWAPWLAASQESMAGRTKVFPEGQLLLKQIDGTPLASLSMNQVSWNGDPMSLPCWDDVAGDPTTYENTYKADGNTLVMMSMNVHPEFQGNGFAKKLIDEAKKTAESLDVTYLIGSFRPNEYGKHKLACASQGVVLPDFPEYAAMKRDDGLPVDAWLRNLTRNGMEPLAVDDKAMTVSMSFNEWVNHLTHYNPQSWFKTDLTVWECSEVGSWSLDLEQEVATYKEANLWGLVWQKPGLQ